MTDIRIAVQMTVPEGKLPGFYAQLVKAIANRVTLHDRDKETLILQSEDDLGAIKEVMNKFKLDYETMYVYALPEAAQLRPTADDFGFTTKLGLTYFPADTTAMFSFTKKSEDAEQALVQMEEHLLAAYESDEGLYLVTQAIHDELMERIAAAYRCQIAWIKP